LYDFGLCANLAPISTWWHFRTAPTLWQSRLGLHSAQRCTPPPNKLVRNPDL
jgi:hypothetical protein